MNSDAILSVQSYFAASNGYCGFKSYFDEVFSPENYEKIFILKGGPGTGKSSLMKKVLAAFSSDEYERQAIYCSSDRRSLDGVIIGRGDALCAVIDGTAPHSTDPKLPGAVEEIINLGDNWDDRWISANKGKITEGAAAKSKAYKTAYYYLSLAGTGRQKILDCAKRQFDIKKAKSEIKNLAEELCKGQIGRQSIRLISSFGKDGYTTLNTLETIAKKHYRIVGEGEYPLLFMRALKAEISETERGTIYFPSPLDPSDTEAIFIEESGVAVSIAGEGEGIEASRFVKENPTANEECRCAKRIYDDALLEAQRYFSIASELHFGLEKIYSAAMDFEKNDAVCALIIEKIGNILEEKA